MPKLSNHCILDLYKKDLVCFQNQNKLNVGACNYFDLLYNEKVNAVKDLSLFKVFIILEAESWEIENADLLKKILAATKLDEKQIVVLNHLIFKLSEQDLININNSYFLVFGIPHTEFLNNDDLELYIEFQQNPNKNIFLFSENLSVLNNSSDKKKILWQTLKKIFNV